MYHPSLTPLKILADEGVPVETDFVYPFRPSYVFECYFTKDELPTSSTCKTSYTARHFPLSVSGCSNVPLSVSECSNVPLALSVSVCSNVPLSVSVCSNVPLSVSVCSNVPLSVGVCSNVPLSDSVCSNVPGFESHVCFISERDPQNLVDRMEDYLETISTKAFQTLKETCFKEHLEALDDEKDACRLRNTLFK